MKKSARNNSDNSGLSAGRKQKPSSHGAPEVPMDGEVETTFDKALSWWANKNYDQYNETTYFFP